MFSVVVIKSVYGVLIVILMSSLLGVFSRGSLVKETAAISGRLANVLSKEGRMAPSTTSKKDLGVVTLLVTAEREQDSFFCLDGSFSLRMCCPSFYQGLLGVSVYS